MSYKKRIIFSISFTLIMTFAISCGLQPNSSASSNPSTPTSVSSISTATVVGTTNIPSATPTNPTLTIPTSTPISSTPTSSPTGAVTLTPGKSQFAPNEALTLTLTNGLNAPITVSDHQSGCTIVTLQLQLASNWQDQQLCRQGAATRLLTLPAGSSQTITLVPGATMQVKGGSWAQGQYRFAFTFATGPTDSESASPHHQTPIYSPIFTVN